MALNVKNLSINIGDREILVDQSVGIADHSKVGVIGRNGVGKTTFLKALLGQQEYHGEIDFNGKAVYFSQSVEFDMDKTVREIIGVKAKSHNKGEFEKKIAIIEQQMANPKVYENHDKLNKLTEEYLHLQNQMTTHNDSLPTGKIKSILNTLKVGDDWLDKKVNNLSTGQRAIVALAQILSSDAELLLLDEPTNHLDFQRIDILEHHLTHFRGTVMMVTHDRHFLDRVCNTILKMENGKWTKYNGNYTAYVKTSKASFAAESHAYEIEQKYLANEKDKIARIGKGKAKVKQGKYREKQLAKREEMDKPNQDKSRFQTVIEAQKIHGTTVLELEDVSVGYDFPLIEHVNLRVGNGEKIILTGENGIGKSTLLKTIEGRVKILAGKITLHEQGKLSYVDQELKDLTGDNTLFEEIHKIVGATGKTRQQLSLCGFVDNDDVNKEISKLSFGEKSRLNLLKVLLEKPNILLLDEPTNHLDLDACEIIENAFLKYKGAIFAVSHDNYFIDKIADRVLEVRDGKLKQFIRKK